MDMLVEAASGLVATALSEAIMTPLDACKTLQQESATPLSLIAAAAQLLAQATPSCSAAGALVGAPGGMGSESLPSLRLMVPSIVTTATQQRHRCENTQPSTPDRARKPR